MNTSFDSTDAQFAWDSTSLKLAEDCLRKYKYKLIDGWQPKRKSAHLLFGGWYATALEHYHKFRALGDDLDTALEKVVHEALMATWEYEYETYEPAPDLSPGAVNIALKQRPVPGSGKPWLSDHTTKTRENLIRTIIWYIDQFADESIVTVMKSDGTPCVELSFSFEVDGTIFAGHLDRLVEFNGDVFVMDQKTTGSTLTSYYFDQYDPDTQMSLYTLAGQIIYQAPVKGVIIDAAQIAVGSSRFSRGFTFRDRAKLDEWLESALDTIERARRATHENNFPINPSSCGKYAGCEFRGICSRTPGVRENFLVGDFIKSERWDPLKRR